MTVQPVHGATLPVLNLIKCGIIYKLSTFIILHELDVIGASDFRKLRAIFIAFKYFHGKNACRAWKIYFDLDFLRGLNRYMKKIELRCASIKHLAPYMYSARNLEMSIRFSLKSPPSEWFPRPEMSQIKAEISLRTNVKLIFHKNVGLQRYQWIPDFYNILFWQIYFMEKNY